ncbi:MAG: hypothetical protein KDK25_11190 [Leptospiraceae bacterium]|nr:hypothetical protein [Leptospiraceae bacterium]
MSFRLQDHAFFRPAVLVFSLFTLAQLITGSILYVEKIGLHPAGALEFYAGSEKMLQEYPDRPDRFRNPATFHGLLKTAVSHSLAYGLFAFLLLHLLRSLLPDGRARKPAEWLGLLVYLFAFLDILSGFLIAYGPSYMAYFRTPVFSAFVGSVSLCALWLIVLSLQASNSPYDWGSDGRRVDVAEHRKSEEGESPKKSSTKQTSGAPSV